MALGSAPFFIVGSGRSGTTLLRMILASHSRLTIPPETWFLLPLLQRLDPVRPLTKAELEFAVNTVIHHYRWPDMKLPAAEFRQRVDRLQQASLREVVEVIYRDHTARENKPRWGDKTPGYIEIVPQLLRMFPGSKFIYLCRDGRDVAKSFQRQGWYGPWLHHNFREWSEASDWRARWDKAEYNNHLLDVHYEDLVLDTDRVVHRICDFLDEPFEPQMLAWQSRVDDLVPAREMVIHGKLRRAPLEADDGRWRREMTVREQLVSEAFIGTRLERSGYPRRFESRLWRPAFPLVRCGCIAFSAAAFVTSRLLRPLRWLGLRRPAAL